MNLATPPLADVCSICYLQKFSSRNHFINQNLYKRFVKTSSLISMLFALLLVSSAAMANNINTAITKPSRGKKYHAKVTLMDGQKVKGILKLIGNDRIQLLNRKTIGKVRNGFNIVPDTLHYRDIESIKVRNTGLGILGSIGGTVVGTIVGAIVGYLVPNWDTYSYDDELRGLTALLGGGIGAVGGAIGGTQLASRNFVIGGDYSTFDDFRLRMTKKGMVAE